MAVFNLPNYLAKDGFGMSLNIRRGNPNPLDNSSVWASLEAAQNYAKTDPVAYVGQVLTVVTDVVVGEETVKTATAYVIDNEAGDLKAVGTSPAGDESTIVVAEDGTVSLYGIEGLALTREESDGSVTNITYQPLFVNGKLTWVEPSATTVEGLATEIEGLKTRISAVEATIGNETDGLVKDVADNAAAIAQNTADITAINNKIGEVTEGKTVAEMITDAQTAATYDDTQIKVDIKANTDAIDTIEADYLKAADKDILSGLITAEQTRAEGIEAGLRTDVDVIKGDYLKTADKEALQNQINTIMNNPETEGVIDSINEFATYIAEHGTIAEGFRTDIDQNKDDIAENAAAIAGLANVYETKEDATAKLTDAKGYTDTKATALQDAIDTLDESVDNILADYLKAEDKTELQGNINTLQSAVDALEAVGAEKNVIASVDTTQFDIDGNRNLTLLDIAMAKVTGLTDAIAGLQKGGSLVEPADDDIPKVYFTGDTAGMSKTNTVDLRFEYRSKTATYSGTANVKWQGSSSLSYPEKNYTIKLYKDSAKTEKMKLDVKGWGQQNKFCLKANYVDTLHLRNIVGARIAYDMIKSRSDFDSLPTELKEAPRCGVIDGFPIKVFINGTLQGIYTWNIPKDKWQMNMDEDNPNHALLMAEKNNNGSANPNALVLACEFRANATIFADTSEAQYPPYDWVVEAPGDDVSSDIRKSFNTLINCIKDTDDETFKTTIGKHLDLTSAFDYYSFAYLMCHYDGLGKNLGMSTYDGIKWFCVLYDMDSIFGAKIDGSGFLATTRKCPEEYQETNSLLWERIEKCFGAELYARYTELRNGALSLANIITHAERFYDTIPSEYYAEDRDIWTEKPSQSTNTIGRLRNYIAERAEYVDSEMLAIGDGGSGEVEPDEPDNPIIPPDNTSTTTVTLTAGKGINLSTGDLKDDSDKTKTLESYYPVRSGRSYTISVPDGYGWVIAYTADYRKIDTLVQDSPTLNIDITISSPDIAYIRWGCYGESGVLTSNITYADIPCTGISLSDNTLVFDNHEPQIITATPTPDDTTDDIMWESDDMGVCIVSDGIVTPVANGNAIITATCGEYSATCSVSVSGIESVTLPTPLLALESKNVDTSAMVWSDSSGNEVDFTLSDGTPDVNDNGLQMTSCKVTGTKPITLAGAFSYDIELMFNEVSGTTNAFFSFNQANTTKYADNREHKANQSMLKLNGYSGNTTTTLNLMTTAPMRLTVVRDTIGNTVVYKNGMYVGEFTRGTFTASGAFDIVLGASSYGGYPITASKFRIKRLRIYDVALSDNQIRLLSQQ